MTDDLLQPTVSNEPLLRDKPWRVSSQFWVAFFGGVLPVTLIAIANAIRLGMPREKRWLMAACGAIGLAVLFVLWLRVPHHAEYPKFVASGRDLRVYGRIAAVVVYLALAGIQRKPDAHHQVFTGGEYASLWGVGVVVTLIAGAVQTVALSLFAWWVR